jgi:hypothetical protein
MVELVDVSLERASSLADRGRPSECEVGVKKKKVVQSYTLQTLSTAFTSNREFCVPISAVRPVSAASGGRPEETRQADTGGSSDGRTYHRRECEGRQGIGARHR